ncbi:MAG: hypothetical protein H6706_14565 [Myxococcales bacterium]|nr:hypothetical protein [Myxococcales bacterium]
MIAASLLVAGLLTRPPPLDDRWLMVGPTAGLRLLDATPGFQVGGEVSLVFADTGGEWQGIYVDAALMPETGLLQGSLGAELGRSFLGLDAGVLALLDEDQHPRFGARVRAVATLALVAAYVGFGGVGGRGAHVEVGTMVKLPLPL